MSEIYSSIMEKVQDRKMVVIDARANNAFLASHIPGSVNVPFNSYGWARSIKSWLDGQNLELALVSDSEQAASKAAEELKSAGLEVPHVIADSLVEWKEKSLPLSSVGELTPDELYSQLDRWTIIDVREPYEWQSGTIKNSLKIPLNDLPSKIQEFTTSDRYAVICAHGNRSEVGALFLADNGLHASTVVGGMYRWMSEQLPVEFEE